MHDLRLENVCQVLSIESLKCDFLVLVLLKVLSQAFLLSSLAFLVFVLFLLVTRCSLFCLTSFLFLKLLGCCGRITCLAFERFCTSF